MRSCAADRLRVVESAKADIGDSRRARESGFGGRGECDSSYSKRETEFRGPKVVLADRSIAEVDERRVAKGARA
jgi:hypothetical protein